MNRKMIRWFLVTGCFFFALLIVAGLSLSVGSAGIPVGKIASLLSSHETSSVSYRILMDVRLPRILLGLAVGGALSLAGVILQGIFRNPLVEPYTLGISGGAALGVSLSIVSGVARLPGLTRPLSGFMGAAVAIGLLYLLNSRRGIIRLSGLLLNGVMLSFVASSLVMLILSLARMEDVHGIIFWIMGGLDEPQWSVIRSALAAAVVLFIISCFFARDLNALSVGEEEAQHLGIHVERTKLVLFVVTALLTGLSVSVSGMIGFVGLVVPQALRMMVGGDYRLLLPSAFLGGGAFLIFCDTWARILIAPQELPVGVITGILGGGIFIYALSRREDW